jgi:hypothetical protein
MMLSRGVQQTQIKYNHSRMQTGALKMLLLQRKMIPPIELELFKSRSIAGFLIWLGGPLHWVSKRQPITARSSMEAEIYAIDKCMKCIQCISNILSDLNLAGRFTDDSVPVPIKNDNEAAVNGVTT